jgi:hypothetical protein
MGVSTDGILAYGWDMGHGEQLPEGIQERIWQLSSQHTERTLAELGMVRPAAAHVRTPANDALWSHWHEQSARAARTAPIELVEHCLDDEPMFIITHPALNWIASRGYPVHLGSELSVDPQLTDQVRHAAASLGINLVGEPCWLLASRWW